MIHCTLTARRPFWVVYLLFAVCCIFDVCVVLSASRSPVDNCVFFMGFMAKATRPCLQAVLVRCWSVSQLTWPQSRSKAAEQQNVKAALVSALHHSCDMGSAQHQNLWGQKKTTEQFTPLPRSMESASALPRACGAGDGFLVGGASPSCESGKRA